MNRRFFYDSEVIDIRDIDASTIRLAVREDDKPYIFYNGYHVEEDIQENERMSDFLLKSMWKYLKRNPMYEKVKKGWMDILAYDKRKDEWWASCKYKWYGKLHPKKHPGMAEEDRIGWRESYTWITFKYNSDKSWKIKRIYDQNHLDPDNKDLGIEKAEYKNLIVFFIDPGKPAWQYPKRVGMKGEIYRATMMPPQDVRWRR